MDRVWRGYWSRMDWVTELRSRRQPIAHNALWWENPVWSECELPVWDARPELCLSSHHLTYGNDLPQVGILQIYCWRFWALFTHTALSRFFFVLFKMGLMQLYGTVYAYLQKDQRCCLQKWWHWWLKMEIRAILLMVCSHFPTPRPIRRLIINGLCIIVWRCSYWTSAHIPIWVLC